MPVKFVETDGRGPNYAHEDNDCSVRAISVAASMSYEAAHELVARAGRMPRQRFHTWRALAFARYRLAGYRVKPMPIPDVNTLARTLKLYPEGRYIVRTEGHVFAVIDGTVYDLDGPTGPRKRVTHVWEVA